MYSNANDTTRMYMQDPRCKQYRAPKKGSEHQAQKRSAGASKQGSKPQTQKRPAEKLPPATRRKRKNSKPAGHEPTSTHENDSDSDQSGSPDLDSSDSGKLFMLVSYSVSDRRHLDNCLFDNA